MSMADSTVNGTLGTNLRTIVPRSKYHQNHPHEWEDAPSKLQLGFDRKRRQNLAGLQGSQADGHVISSFKSSLSP